MYNIFDENYTLKRSCIKKNKAFRRYAFGFVSHGYLLAGWRIRV